MRRTRYGTASFSVLLKMCTHCYVVRTLVHKVHAGTGTVSYACKKEKGNGHTHDMKSSVVAIS